MVEGYIPEQGDIVYADFMTELGQGQKERRPAIILSNKIYNNVTGMAIVAPITPESKDFPFHIKLDSSVKTTGSIMCEQIRAIDCKKRKLQFIERLNQKTFFEIKQLLENFFD